MSDSMKIVRDERGEIVEIEHRGTTIFLRAFFVALLLGAGYLFWVLSMGAHIFTGGGGH